MVGTSSRGLSPADQAAAARETVASFVRAQRSAGRFIPSSQLIANADGFLIFQNINDDFTSGQIGIVVAAFDQNDWLRLNNDGSATIHFVDHSASAIYIDLASGAVAFGDGANLVMDFSGGLLQWGNYYYVDFFQPFTSYNFHGTGRVQFDGVGPMSTMVAHSSQRGSRLNEFVRLN